jgi:hypothetical protein
MRYVSTETGSPTSDAPRARDGTVCLLRVCAISLAVEYAALVTGWWDGGHEAAGRRSDR